jgi:hypothetical protein
MEKIEERQYILEILTRLCFGGLMTMCSGTEIAPAAVGANDVNIFERLALVAEEKKVRMLDLFRMVSLPQTLPLLSRP